VIDKVEKLARIIAKSVTGLDPDTRISPVEQRPIGYLAAWVVQPDSAIQPLWKWYETVARDVFAAGFDCIDYSPASVESVEETSSGETVAWDQTERDARAAAQKANEEWRERMGLA
jgi:hypothetical protein